ncbi:hypothetical protein M422DRAFT_243058 [Sphaerobolus stellatus SS14]|nr:hypothetical protein M422DRAFT_243058 [Sphaerobolus stellatus SS14]
MSGRQHPQLQMGMNKLIGTLIEMLESVDTFILHGVRRHDQAQTHFRRVGRALVRSAAVQRRTVQENDSELEKSYIQLSRLQEDTQKQTVALKQALENGEATGKVERALKKLRTTETKYAEIYTALPTLEGRSSGHVQLPNLAEPSRLLSSTISRTQEALHRSQLEPSSSSSSSSFSYYQSHNISYSQESNRFIPSTNYTLFNGISHPPPLHPPLPQQHFYSQTPHLPFN